MLQILRISDLPRSWLFLSQAQKNNSILSRRALVARCVKDLSVLSFICDSTLKIVSLDQTGRACRASISLCTVVLLETISASVHLSDPLLRAIFPHIIAGLKLKKCVSMQWASYMILIQLCRLSNLNHEKFLAPAISYIIKFLPGNGSARNDLYKALQTLASIFQSQKLTIFPPNAFKILVKVPLLPVVLKELAGKYDCSYFLQAFLDALCSLHLRHSNYQTLFLSLIESFSNSNSNSPANSEELGEQVGLNENTSSSKTLLIEYTPRLVEQLILSYLSTLLESEQDKKNEGSESNTPTLSAELAGSLTESLKALEAQCPGPTQSGLQNVIATSQARVSAYKQAKQLNATNNSSSSQEAWTPQVHNRLLALISGVFCGSALDVLTESGSTVLFALQNPIVDIRLTALQRLNSFLTAAPAADKKDSHGVLIEQTRGALLDSLKHESDYKVLSKTLTVLTSLLNNEGKSSSAVDKETLQVIASVVLKLTSPTSHDSANGSASSGLKVAGKALSLVINLILPRLVNNADNDNNETIILETLVLLLEYVPVITARSKITQKIWSSLCILGRPLPPQSQPRKSQNPPKIAQDVPSQLPRSLKKLRMWDRRI